MRIPGISTIGVYALNAGVAEMIYDFYTIGVREGVKDVMYVGSTNSFSIGLEIVLDKVTEKLAAPLQGLEIGLTVSKEVQSLRNDDCFLVHVSVLGKQWFTGVHYHKDNEELKKDYKDVFLKLQAEYAPPLLEY
jgi:hypothetical protein